jgi:hypothetical protein
MSTALYWQDGVLWIQSGPALASHVWTFIALLLALAMIIIPIRRPHPKRASGERAFRLIGAGLLASLCLTGLLLSKSCRARCDPKARSIEIQRSTWLSRETQSISFEEVQGAKTTERMERTNRQSVRRFMPVLLLKTQLELELLASASPSSEEAENCAREVLRALRDEGPSPPR